MLASHFKKKKKTRMISPTVSRSATLVSPLSSSSPSPQKKSLSPASKLNRNVDSNGKLAITNSARATPTRDCHHRESLENYSTVLQKYKSDNGDNGDKVDNPTGADANISFSFGFEVEDTPKSLPNSSKTRRRRDRRKNQQKQQENKKRENKLLTAETQNQSARPNDKTQELEMEAMHSFAQSVEPLITQSITQHCCTLDRGDGSTVNEVHERTSSAGIQNHTTILNPTRLINKSYRLDKKVTPSLSTDETYTHSGGHHITKLPSAEEPTGIQNSAETKTQRRPITPTNPRNVIPKVAVSTAGIAITSSHMAQQTPHKKASSKQARKTPPRVKQRKCKRVAKKKEAHIIQFNPSDKGKAMVNHNSLAVHREKNRMIMICPQTEARAFTSTQADGRDLPSGEKGSESNAFTFGFNFDRLLSGVP